ncbi:LemA family protein [Alkalimarinus coralli]|uniref:LemA family protein n=1 Tax=Alkalimarinus coralli TaxID=2935863 RepID=UPI00202B75AE|nr:LemA family protein [Alkalimarinus coralli]
MKKALTSPLLFLCIAAALCFVAFMLLPKGFDEIERIRQLERIPEISINTVLQGEVSVKGKVTPQASLLQSRYSDTPSVYYRYLHEEERVDSDGDRHWVTVTDEHRAVDFTITDATGSINVSTNESRTQPILWSMPSSMRTTVGKYRHTEWRIEPGQEVSVTAYALGNSGSARLAFTPEGVYTPIVSKYGLDYERGEKGKSGIFFIWLGLVALAFAVLFVIWAIKIHRIITYLSILTFTLTLVLLHLGITMLSGDLNASMTRLSSQYEVVQQAISAANVPQLESELSLETPTNYNEYADAGVDVSALQRLSDLKVNLALYQAQLKRQLAQFPDSLIGWSMGIDIQQKTIGLTKEEKDKVEQQLNQLKATSISDSWVRWVALAALAGMLIASYVGFRKIRFKRFIESIPTSKVSGVVYGLAEIKGKIECADSEAYLTTPVTGKKSVWYYYKKEEKRKSGKNEKWVTLVEERKQLPFFVSDYTGKMKIIADNADVISSNKKVTREGRYRYTEEYLKPNETLYAIGSAQVDENDPARLQIADGDKSVPFILSNLSEQQVMLRKARNGMIFLNMAFSALLLGALLLFASSGGLSPDNFLLSALTAPIFMIGFMVILHYNDIIFLRQRVERNIANIKVVLQKRFDLIPNLEKSVKHYLAHEKSLLEQITALRRRYQPDNMSHQDKAGQTPNAHPLSTSMKAIIEQYPELLSHQVIKQLMDSITDIEDELSMMREGYLDAVEIYNARIQTFPDVLLTKLFGFKQHDLLSWNG